MPQPIPLTRWLSIIFSLFIPSLVFANTPLVWPDAPNGRLYRIDVAEKKLETEIQPNVWQVLGVVRLKNVSADAFPSNTRVTCLPVGTSEFRYLLVDCTQQVYQFNTRTLTLERLDNTFFRGYNCLSAKFIRRDTLYSVGGYGFWHTNNIISYYKAAGNEWESVNSVTNAPHSLYQGFNGYLPETDRFLSAISFYQNDSENKGAFTWSDSVYAYSFSKRTWEMLGQLTQQFRAQIPTDFVEKATWFQAGSYFVLKYYKSPQTFFLLVDPVRNEARIWQDTRKLLANLSDTYDNNIPGSYVWHNTLYFRRYATGVTGKSIDVVRLPIADVWRDSTAIGAFYEPIRPKSNWWLYALPITLLLLGTGVVYWFRKSGKTSIVPASADLSYPNSLKDKEKTLFDALLQAGTPDGLTSEAVNDMLSIGDKSVDNQRRIRSEMIKKVNLKLKLEWDVDEAIERIPTALDQRMVTYALKEAVRNRVQPIQPDTKQERE